MCNCPEKTPCPCPCHKPPVLVRFTSHRHSNISYDISYVYYCPECGAQMVYVGGWSLVRYFQCKANKEHRWILADGGNVQRKCPHE
jgi:hypothetical protein